MPPVVGVCPHCRRPNDEAEIAAAFAAARERRARRRRLAARAAIVLAAAAVAYWRRAALRADAGVLLRDAAALRDPASEAAPESGPKRAPPVPGQPRAMTPEAAAPASAQTAVEAAAALGANDWPLVGRVHDLKSLQPVPRARLLFACPERGLTRTADADDQGRFAVGLSALGAEGYAVRVIASGYAPAVMDEPDVPYAQLSESERAHLIESAREGDVATSRILAGDASEKGIDVYLAPREDSGSRP